MRLLADENLEGAIVEWLRRESNDVYWIAESAAQSSDAEILEFAIRENRVVVTNDQDFGELAVRSGRRLPGVVLIRAGGLKGTALLDLLARSWAQAAENAPGHLVVIGPRRLRVRPI